MKEGKSEKDGLTKKIDYCLQTYSSLLSLAKSLCVSVLELTRLLAFRRSVPRTTRECYINKFEKQNFAPFIGDRTDKENVLLYIE